MMQFAPLVSVTVEHAYFANGLAHGLKLRPDAITAKRLRAPWYAWRTDGCHLTIASDNTNPPPADEADAPFRFLAWVTDPLLPAASEPFLSEGPQILHLSMADKVLEPDGRWRLHPGVHAGAAGLGDAAADATPHPAVPERRPLFELTITAPAEKDRPMRCVIRLASRQVFWTYMVQGAMARGALSIVDTDGAHDFDALGEAPLPGNRTARIFRSTAPLALAERPPFRFQLREKSSVAERVLLRRLPGAGPNFRPVPGQDGQAMQAEIFVNV